MRRILTLLLCALLLLATGCAEIAPPAANGNGTGQQLSSGQPATGLELRIMLSAEPLTLDPALNANAAESSYILHMFEGLMKLSPPEEGGAGVLACGQAADYTVSEDGLTYTFRLRQNIFWSDGEPVTADHFIYAWQRLADPAIASPNAYLLKDVVNAERIINGELKPDRLGISAPDQQTLVVKLARINPAFPEICAHSALAPLREDALIRYAENWSKSPAGCLSNGPYMMTEWVQGSHIACQHNPYYQTAEPGPDRLLFRFGADAATAWAAYNNKEVDFISSIPRDERASLIDERKLTVAPRLGCSYVAFNTALIPFSDSRVREALSLAIDRDYIVEFVTQAGETAATALIPAGISQNDAGDDFRAMGGDYFSADEEDNEANLERARELLAEAGYPEGEGFPAIRYIFISGEQNRMVAEALAYMWQTGLHIPVELINLDAEAFAEAGATGDFSLAQDSTHAAYGDPQLFLSVFAADSRRNHTGYRNEGYAAALAAAEAALDANERTAALHQAEDILMKDAVIAPLYYHSSMGLLREDFTGMYWGTTGEWVFINCL